MKHRIDQKIDSIFQDIARFRGKLQSARIFSMQYYGWREVLNVGVRH